MKIDLCCEGRGVFIFLYSQLNHNQKVTLKCQSRDASIESWVTWPEMDERMWRIKGILLKYAVVHHRPLSKIQDHVNFWPPPPSTKTFFGATKDRNHVLKIFFFFFGRNSCDLLFNQKCQSNNAEGCRKRNKKKRRNRKEKKRKIWIWLNPWLSI